MGTRGSTLWSGKRDKRTELIQCQCQVIAVSGEDLTVKPVEFTIGVPEQWTVHCNEFWPEEVRSAYRRRPSPACVAQTGHFGQVNRKAAAKKPRRESDQAPPTVLRTGAASSEAGLTTNPPLCAGTVVTDPTDKNHYIFMWIARDLFVWWANSPTSYFFVGQRTDGENDGKAWFQWRPRQWSQNTSAVAAHNPGVPFGKDMTSRVRMWMPTGCSKENPPASVLVRLRVWPGTIDTFLGVEGWFHDRYEGLGTAHVRFATHAECQSAHLSEDTGSDFEAVTTKRLLRMYGCTKR